jgi:chlorite dismutase
MTRESKKGDSRGQGLCVQFVFFKVAQEWRRLPPKERESGMRDFEDKVTATGSAVPTLSYSTIGLSAKADFMLWRRAETPEPLQEGLARLLQTGIGRYLEVTNLYFGLTRSSVYTGRRTSQEQAIDEAERLPYFVLYPFTKTADWYILPTEVRQGMMNEHIKVGRSFPAIRQVLLYSTGLADQEFIVGYETRNLDLFQDLVTALRHTEGRRYTLSDTPIFTCIHRSLDDTLALL